MYVCFMFININIFIQGLIKFIYFLRVRVRLNMKTMQLSRDGRMASCSDMVRLYRQVLQYYNHILHNCTIITDNNMMMIILLFLLLLLS